MKNKTPRPYKLPNGGGNKGLRMCYDCGHYFPREELKNSRRGLKCLFCKGLKISEPLKAPKRFATDGEDAWIK